MKQLLTKTIVLLFTAIFALISCNRSAEQQKMNVLLIFSDDLNDWNSVLSGHSQAITPNIERLAGSSVVFTNAHCPSPACGPSRASILTGYYPPKTGVFGNADNFRETPGMEDAVTLPQYFAAHGYYTTASGKVFHHPRGNEEEPAVLSDDISWHKQYIGNVGSQAPQPLPEQVLEIPTTDYFGRNFIWGASPVVKEQTHDYLLTKYSADFLQESHDENFFLACGIFRPHLSWFVPQEFIDLYELDDIVLPEVYEDDLDDLPPAALSFIKPYVHDALLKQDLWKEAVRAYLASTSFADYCIGVLLDALENSEYKDNTIVILMGDHGWHLGEKTHWSKFTLWERATRTTFMMHVPGIEPGRSDAPVNLTDLYPTLVDICGLDPKKDLEGRSLKPLLNNPEKSWPYPAITWYAGEKNYSIKDYSWRYIHYADGSEELYDHNTDPHEWHNLASDIQFSSKIRELRNKSGLGENHRLPESIE